MSAFVKALQTNPNSSSLSTNVITTEDHHRAGNPIILGASNSAAILSVSTIEDSVGNSYFRLKSAGSGTALAELWMTNGLLTVPASSTITVTYTGPTASVVGAWEFAGITTVEDHELGVSAVSTTPSGFFLLNLPSVSIAAVSANTSSALGSFTSAGTFTTLCDQKHPTASTRLIVEYLESNSPVQVDYSCTLPASVRWGLVLDALRFPSTNRASNLLLLSTG